MESSIICIGNRFVAEDAAGPLVFERIGEQALPSHIHLVEGGLAGLNLLPYLERGGRVVFVDSMQGIAAPGTVAVLDWQEITAMPVDPHFGHETGLAYLLSVLPKVCDGRLPEEIVLVGLEGTCSDQMIEAAATLSVAIAVNGLKGNR